MTAWSFYRKKEESRKEGSRNKDTVKKRIVTKTRSRARYVGRRGSGHQAPPHITTHLSFLIPSLTRSRSRPSFSLSRALIPARFGALLARRPAELPEFVLRMVASRDTFARSRTLRRPGLLLRVPRRSSALCAARAFSPREPRVL